jgi:hypothetical protein
MKIFNCCGIYNRGSMLDFNWAKRRMCKDYMQYVKIKTGRWIGVFTNYLCVRVGMETAYSRHAVGMETACGRLGVGIETVNRQYLGFIRHRKSM